MRSKPLHIRRQLRLPFAGSDLWENLPREVQAECVQHLSRILTEVITDDQREGRQHHEQQDQI